MVADRPWIPTPLLLADLSDAPVIRKGKRSERR
jgi:hypothetical protein